MRNLYYFWWYEMWWWLWNVTELESKYLTHRTGAVYFYGRFVSILKQLWWLLEVIFCDILVKVYKTVYYRAKLSLLNGWLIIILKKTGSKLFSRCEISSSHGGSTHLWNVGRQSFYTAVHPRRQFWTSYLADIQQLYFPPKRRKYLQVPEVGINYVIGLQYEV
jgi:hypothetical protein